MQPSIYKKYFRVYKRVWWSLGLVVSLFCFSAMLEMFEEKLDQDLRLIEIKTHQILTQLSLEKFYQYAEITKKPTIEIFKKEVIGKLSLKRENKNFDTFLQKWKKKHHITITHTELSATKTLDPLLLIKTQTFMVKGIAPHIMSVFKLLSIARKELPGIVRVDILYLKPSGDQKKSSSGVVMSSRLQQVEFLMRFSHTYTPFK